MRIIEKIRCLIALPFFMIGFLIVMIGEIISNEHIEEIKYSTGLIKVKK